MRIANFVVLQDELAYHLVQLVYATIISSDPEGAKSILDHLTGSIDRTFLARQTAQTVEKSRRQLHACAEGSEAAKKL